LRDRLPLFGEREPIKLGVTGLVSQPGHVAVVIAATSKGLIRIDLKQWTPIGNCVPVELYPQSIRAEIVDRRMVIAYAAGGSAYFIVQREQPLIVWIEGGAIETVSFGRCDGRQIVAAANRDGSIHLFDASSLEPIRRLPPGHRGHVLDMVQLMGDFDGVLASGGDDGTLRLWDVARAQEVATIDIGVPVYWVVNDAYLLGVATPEG